MKTTCIIVDDEPIAREILRNFIAEINTLSLVAECKNAIEANDIIREKQVDLIFLDINMPKISGIDFYKALNNPPIVIFTTGYSSYALEGFELDAIDYLLKPFSLERFIKAVNKALTKQQKETEEVIFLKADKKTYRIPILEIDYLEALGDYVKVSYGQKSIMVHSTFHNLLNQLNDKIITRIHKSYAIAINKVEHFEKHQLSIKGKTLPIGPTYKSLFSNK